MNRRGFVGSLVAFAVAPFMPKPKPKPASIAWFDAAPGVSQAMRPTLSFPELDESVWLAAHEVSVPAPVSDKFELLDGVMVRVPQRYMLTKT